MRQKLIVYCAVTTLAVVGTLIFRLEDVESIWLLTEIRQKNFMSDIELLPRADRVALSMLRLPVHTSNGELYQYLVANLSFDYPSPRIKVLKLLNANPLTPDPLLKLRLKELALTFHLMASHDPAIGSHGRTPIFELVD